jgi:hypothetical protein
MARGEFSRPYFTLTPHPGCGFRGLFSDIGNHDGEQSSQVPFVEGNHVIQEIAAATPYPALGDTVLPRVTDRRSDGGESHGFYSALNLGKQGPSHFPASLTHVTRKTPLSA